MEILVAKSLSALLLWILSLCFGLMIPYLLWRSRSRSRQSADHDCQQAETNGLVSDEENPPNYRSTANGQAIESSVNSVQNAFKRFHDRIMKYDILSFINCCCGGLFLGVCFLDLLPESRKDIEEILTDLNVHTELPVTEFIVSLGLILVMLIENSVNSMCVRRCTSRNRSYNTIDETGSPHDGSNCSTVRPTTTDDQSLANVEIQSYAANCDDSDDSADATEATRSIVLIAMLSVHSIFEGLALGLEMVMSNLIQLLVAIAVHKSVLAFGLGMKLFETFTPNRVLVAVACSLIFCTGSPLGCAIGIITTLGNDNTTNQGHSNVTTMDPGGISHSVTATEVTGTMYATAILECLAAGTFLYVTFVEVIPQEFAHSKEDHGFGNQNSRSQRPRKIPISPFCKLFGFIIGFGIVTGLQFI